jgi:hypothetical protein
MGLETVFGGGVGTYVPRCSEQEIDTFLASVEDGERG